VFTGMLCISGDGYSMFPNQHAGLKQQVSYLSWWPRENVFNSSGIWPGYWSHGCEDWFQRQYAAIVQGDKQHGKPRLAHQWSNALKLDKRVKHLCHSNTATAKNFLERSTFLE